MRNVTMGHTLSTATDCCTVSGAHSVAQVILLDSFTLSIGMNVEEKSIFNLFKVL